MLLVDDHPINRQVISLFLRPFGMRIVQATNGKEALAVLTQEPFDMVLLDIHMPIMDGVETIRAIRSSDEVWSNVPVIALTADAMTGDKERYLALGMQGYLPKPIVERDLIAEIARVRNFGSESKGGAEDIDRRLTVATGPIRNRSSSTVRRSRPISSGRKRRPAPPRGGRLDEMVRRIGGERMFLQCAIDGRHFHLGRRLKRKGQARTTTVSPSGG